MVNKIENVVGVCVVLFVRCENGGIVVDWEGKKERKLVRSLEVE